MSCKVIPQADRLVKSFGPVEVLATAPVFQLGVEAGDHKYLIFIPLRVLALGKGGFRFSVPRRG
ncbi:hypothetical protein XF30_20100 [Bradyrhizobium sp. SUTN9-2]|nr:hypothetical protein XF30_20100 [Bradyrhizobium sp. SUTN9-2]